MRAPFGHSLDVSKGKPHSRSSGLLGATIDIRQDSASALPPFRRVSVLIEELNAALSRGRLTPAADAKLRGRLGFAHPLAFGNLGRARLSPFSDRQYPRPRNVRRALNDEIRGEIDWRITRLGKKCHRRAPFSNFPLSRLHRCLRGGPCWLYTILQRRSLPS